MRKRRSEDQPPAEVPAPVLPGGGAVSSEPEAVTVAERFLDEVVRPESEPDLVITTVRSYPTCWVVGYNTRAFVESQSIMDALAGGGPVIINRATGQARLGTHEVPPEQQLDP